MKTMLYSYWSLAFVPLLITLVFFPMFPEIIPAHINHAGEVTRWGSRSVLFMMPAMTIAMAIFIRVVEKIGGSSIDWYSILAMMICIGFQIYIMRLFYINATPVYTVTFDFMRASAIILGFFYVLVGAMFRQTKQNKVFGIRTKATLECEQTWDKTHKYAGKRLVILGLTSVIPSL